MPNYHIKKLILFFAIFFILNSWTVAQPQQQADVIISSFAKLIQKHRQALQRMENDLDVSLKPVVFILDSAMYQYGVQEYLNRIGYPAGDSNDFAIAALFAPSKDTIIGFVNPRLVARPSWNWERLSRENWIPGELFEKRISGKLAILNVPFSNALEQQVIEIAILQQLYEGRLLREPKSEFGNLLQGFVSYKVSQALGDEYQILTNTNEILLCSLLCFDLYEIESILKRGKPDELTRMLLIRLPKIYDIDSATASKIVERLRSGDSIELSILDTFHLQPRLSDSWLNSSSVPILFKMTYVQKLAQTSPVVAESLAINLFKSWTDKFQDKAILSQEPRPFLLFASTLDIISGRNTQSALGRINQHLKSVGFNTSEEKDRDRIILQFTQPRIGYRIDFVGKSNLPSNEKVIEADSTGELESGQKRVSGGGSLGRKRILLPLLFPALPFLLGGKNVHNPRGEGQTTSPSPHSQSGGNPSKETSVGPGAKPVLPSLSQSILITDKPLQDLSVEFLKQKVSGPIWDNIIKRLSNKSITNWDVASVKRFNSECVFLLQKPGSDKALYHKHIRSIFQNYIVPVMKNNPSIYFDDSLGFPQLLDVIDDGGANAGSIRTDLKKFGYINGLPVHKCDNWIRIRCKKCNCLK